MSLTEKELRSQIVEIGRLMFDKGWVAANDGNISARLDAERLLATPTNISKGMMTPDDLIVCDLDGNKVAGRRERTSEILMHTTIYRLRPDVQAVVHAHPPVSTGFAVAGRSLNLALLPEVILGLGCIPLAAYGLPGTPALSDALTPLIPQYDALLMANHGAVCYGPELYKAYFKMETLEHFARITLVAEMLGGPRALPRSEVDKLFDSRSRYGITSGAEAAPGCPLSAEDVGTGAACPLPGAAAANGSGDRFLVTRDELIALVNEAVRARG